MSAEPAESLRQIGALLKSGQFRTAATRLEQVVAAHPRHVEALFLLAGTRQALGDLHGSEALLRRCLEGDPDSSAALTALSELLLKTGRAAEAKPLLRRVLSGAAPHPRAAFLLARQHLEAGRAAQALEVAAPWCRSGRADAELAALHVTACAGLGRQQEAVATWRGVLARAPEDAVAAQTLGLALNAAGDPQEAERALHECVRLAPRNAEAHDRLAQLIWMRTGDIAEATRKLDAALTQYPQDDALRGTKAALLQGAGDPRGAYACLEEAAARPHAHPHLLIRAGLAALDFDSGTALGLAERVLRDQPRNPTARKLLCSACLGVGDGARALAEAEGLMQSSPDDQYLIAMQTTALRLLGDERYAAFCDYERMVFKAHLETPPGWPDLESFLSEVARHLDALHNPHGHRLLYQSLRGGTETTMDLARSADPVIQALFAAFEAPIARYREHIGEGADALRRRNRGASRFNGGWSVRLRSQGYHTSHVHPRGWISSACYIRLPETMQRGEGPAGNLSFGAPGMLTRPALPAEYSVRPEVGLLVLFPSYLWHGTVPFEGREPRVTVAFDVVPERS